MFQKRDLKATAAANPVKISGVALANVSESAKPDPRAPFNKSPYASKIGAPLHATNPAHKTKLATMETTGANITNTKGTLVRGSRRICFSCIIICY